MKIVRNNVTPSSRIICNQCERHVTYAIETADGERICGNCAKKAIEDLEIACESGSLCESVE